MMQKKGWFLSISLIVQKNIHVEFGFRVKDCLDLEPERRIFDFQPVWTEGDCWESSDFELCSKIIDYLVDGALVIKVRLKLVDPLKYLYLSFQRKPIVQYYSRHVLNEESADIVFEVGGNSLKAIRGRRPRLCLLLFLVTESF